MQRPECISHEVEPGSHVEEIASPGNPKTCRMQPRRWLWLLVAVVAGLASTYSLVVPAWEAPDEDAHFNYILFLRQHGRLPVQGESNVAAHHAPLYYLIASLATWPVDTSEFGAQSFRVNDRFIWHGQGQEINYVVHGRSDGFPLNPQAQFLQLARLVSVAMATATVFFVVRTGWLIFPAHPSIGLLAGVLVGLNPQFLFVGGAINNDNLLTLAATLLLWQLVRSLPTLQFVRQWFWFGVTIGIAAMAKISGLVFVAVAGLILAVDSVRRRSWRHFWLRGAALLLPVALATGWWFVRNLQLYGDPMGWRTFLSIYTGTRRITPLSSAEYGRFFRNQFSSYWGAFGWTTVYPPYWFYLAMALVCGAALIGLILFLARDARSLPRRTQAALLVCGLTIGVYETYMLFTITQFDPSFYQGRYLFPVGSALSLLASVGLHRLVPSHRSGALTLGIAIAMALLAVYLPFFVIRAAYAL